MRCTRCRYVFSEELRICPRCKQDMGLILEKIGFFHVSSKEPFLFPEDFLESQLVLENTSKEIKREIEIKFSIPEEI